MEATARDDALKVMGQLVSFIRDERPFGVGSDKNDERRLQVMERLRVSDRNGRNERDLTALEALCLIRQLQQRVSTAAGFFAHLVEVERAKVAKRHSEELAAYDRALGCVE